MKIINHNRIYNNHTIAHSNWLLWGSVFRCGQMELSNNRTTNYWTATVFWCLYSYTKSSDLLMNKCAASNRKFSKGCVQQMWWDWFGFNLRVCSILLKFQVDKMPKQKSLKRIMLCMMRQHYNHLILDLNVTLILSE